jgi:CheY-like chemotaxis protein
MKTRVLVVDDDHLVADTLNLIFLAHGFESEARYSAAEGLERARSFAPGLLLCDVTMPEGSGLELLESLNSEQPSCQMLLLSAYSSNAVKVEEKALQMKRPLKLLRKPCRPEELLREAEALLRTA